MDYTQLIVAGIDAIEQIVAMLVQLRAEAAANSAITPEQEAAFKARLDQIMAGPEWTVIPAPASQTLA